MSPACCAELRVVTAVDTMACRAGSSSAFFTCSARARMSRDRKVSVAEPVQVFLDLAETR